MQGHRLDHIHHRNDPLKKQPQEIARNSPLLRRRRGDADKPESIQAQSFSIIMAQHNTYIDTGQSLFWSVAYMLGKVD